MFKKNQRVRVKPYQRLRTIFVNAEVTPGEVYNKRGYTGTIDSIYGDTGETTYVVKAWRPEYQETSYEEHSAEELEAI